MGVLATGGALHRGNRRATLLGTPRAWVTA